MNRDSRRGSFPRFSRFIAGCFAGLLLIAESGCASSPMDAEVYGTSPLPAARHSPSGTSVFAALIRRMGNRVHVSSRLTPAIRRFGTIVWFGPAGQMPGAEIRTGIDQWLAEDPSRQLVYVGWDFDCAEARWGRIAARARGEQARIALREQGRAALHRDRIIQPPAADPECWWFAVETGPRQPLTSLRLGSEVVAVEGAELGRWRLVPALGDNGGAGVVAALAEGQPFAFELPHPQAGWQVPQVTVINNGSYLLNYQLLFPGNRRMATDLAHRICQNRQPVLFLSTEGATWSDQAYELETPWSWIRHRPMNLIVPHLLVAGLLFVFSLVPALGRPRRLEADDQPGFARHVRAIGHLAARSCDAQTIRRWWITTHSAPSAGREDSRPPTSPSGPSPPPEASSLRTGNNRERA